MLHECAPNKRNVHETALVVNKEEVLHPSSMNFFTQ